jgi:hypothetical protein
MLNQDFLQFGTIETIFVGRFHLREKPRPSGRGGIAKVWFAYA